MYKEHIFIFPPEERLYPASDPPSCTLVLHYLVHANTIRAFKVKLAPYLFSLLRVESMILVLINDGENGLMQTTS